ncbi:MAG TPA: hypothetical protein VFN18_06610 [Solirubrobacterales bacterium]|nr:hypothetical protein [Solirubrobacterales bacterium]
MTVSGFVALAGALIGATAIRAKAKDVAGERAPVGIPGSTSAEGVGVG